MVLHVPGSEQPSDEFLTPTGEWYSIYRAITFDNWLMWKHALPEEPAQRRRLTAEVFHEVQALARRIHELHTTMQEYRRLADTPFQVSRWWDPDGEEPWRCGRRVLLRHKAFTAKQFMRYKPQRSPLKARIVSEHWMELELTPLPSPAAAAPPTSNGERQELRCPGP